jgi:hypothetical protein
MGTTKKDLCVYLPGGLVQREVREEEEDDFALLTAAIARLGVLIREHLNGETVITVG